MKRIKSFCTRGIAIILSALILSCTVIADYEQPVYATGIEESLYVGLRALMQTVMLSMGYSYSNTSDLDISTKGLENVIRSYKDSSSFSDAVTLTGLFNWTIGKKIGDTLDNITDHAGLVTYVKQYIQNQMAGNSSFVSSSSEISNTSITRTTITESTVKSVFHNLPARTSLSGTEYPLHPELYNSKCFCSKVSGSDIYYYFSHSTCSYVVNNSGVISIYTSNGSQLEFDADKVTLYDLYVSPQHITKYGDIYTVGGSNYSYYSSYTLNLSDLTNCFVGAKLFSSVEAMRAYINLKANYSISSRIVGSTSNAKDLTDSIPVTDDSATKKVQTAIESAQSSGTTLTDSQLDEIAAKVVQSINNTSTNTADTPVDMSDTNNLINNVNISVKTLTDLITKYQQKYIDGSSALQKDVDNISDQFKVVNGNNNQENPDPENDPKIWIPPGFFAISFLKPLMEYFSEPISEITKFLDKIMDSVASLPQLFDETGKLYIGNIFTNLSSITSYVGQIAQSIGSLPSAIGDVIEIPEIKPQEIVEAFNNELAWPDIKVDVPAINIPDINIPEIKLPEINFPSIPNYLDILNDILSAIQNLFVIDTAAVGDSADDLKDVWNDHLPFVPKLQNIFANLNFSSSYDYPVIKIQTPAILLPYYKKESIVLLDFKDYAYYFLWARNIVRAMLWVGFAYSIFKHFRVRFHIG